MPHLVFSPPSLPLVLAVLVAVAVPRGVAQNSPGAASPGRLGSVVFEWDDLKFQANANGGRRDVVNQPTRTLENLESHITTLNPGKISHPPHRHPQEEVIFIREGTVEVFINGTTSRVGEGSLLFFASNDLHNLKNVGEVPAVYQVFQFTTEATHAPPVAAAPGRLASAAFDWDKLVVKPTPQGARRDVFDAPTATFREVECHVTTLNAGESPHPVHRHADEEIVVLKEGLLQVTINGVDRLAGPGSILFFASTDEHGVKNVGSTPATYYVVRFRTAATPVATGP